MDAGASPEILYAGQYLRLVKVAHWEYAERVHARGAVVLVAVTDAGRLLLTEQFRVPAGKHVIELPAGLVGDEPGSADEAYAAAGERELLEETGYQARALVPLTSPGPPSSGLSSEVVAFFRAEGLHRVHAGGGVGQENIVVHEIPLAEVPAWIESKQRDGVLVDPKVYAGLYFATQPR